MAIGVYRLPGELKLFALVAPLRPAVVVAVDAGGQLFTAPLPPSMDRKLHRAHNGKGLPEDEGITAVPYAELPRALLLLIVKELDGWASSLDTLILTDREAATLTVGEALQRRWLEQLGRRCDREGFVTISLDDGEDLVVTRRRWVQAGQMPLVTTAPEHVRESAARDRGTSTEAPGDDDDKTLLQ